MVGNNNNKPEFVFFLIEIFEAKYMKMHMRKFFSVEALVHAQKTFWKNGNFGIYKDF